MPTKIIAPGFVGLLQELFTALYFYTENFVPRITKNETEAISLLIKTQLGTEVTLRYVHQHESHRKGLKMHAHKGGGTCQQPWYQHTKVHNTVSKAKKQITASTQERGKAENAEVQSFTLIV